MCLLASEAVWHSSIAHNFVPVPQDAPLAWLYLESQTVVTLERLAMVEGLEVILVRYAVREGFADVAS